MLREWSARMNLVAPSTLDDIRHRHFDDSAQLAKFLPRDANIVDLGSGAGFPGVVLAMLGWNVVCVESIGKKADFLNALKIELNLPNLTIYHDRLEDYIKNIKKGRETPGNKIIFTARAFAPLIKILDYVYGTNSRLFLLKGREIENEILTAKSKYDFNHKLYPSETGDGFIIEIDLFHMK
jgi:16S rRNA (guanine527-N7)-methyltransferase